MAARVNTKFLVILLIGIISAVVIIGGLWFLKVRGDAGRQARRGDEQMQLARQVSDFDEQQECYRKAREFYKRAVGKEPASGEYIQKLEDALLSIHPETADDAREFYGEYVAILAHAADHDPLNVSRHLALLEELFQNARRSGSTGFWTSLRDSARNMWSALPESDPQRIYAMFYLGAAQFSPRMHDLLPPEDPSEGTQLEQGERHLLQFLEAVPDSDVGWGTLLFDELAVAARFSSSSQPSRAQEQLERVRVHMAQARAQVTEGPEVLMASLRLALHDRAESLALVDEETIRADALEMVRRVRERDDPWAIDQAVDLLRRLAWMEGLPEPVEIVDEYLREHPLSPDVRLAKANLHHMKGELDEAEQSARAVLDAGWLKVGFLSQYQPYLRQAAASLIVDIALARWSAAEEAQRGPLVEALEEARDELARLIPEAMRESDWMMIRADAKLAYAKKDYARAAALFDRLARDEAAVDLEILWYVVVCLEREGEIGRALEYTGTALEQQPNNPDFLSMAVRLSIVLHEFDAAAEAAAALLQATSEEDPRIAAAAEALRQHDYPQAGRLLDALLETQPDNRAVALSRQVVKLAVSVDEGAAEDPISATLEVAQAAMDAGEPDSARATLVAALDEAPDDLRLLNALIRVSMACGDSDEGHRYLQRAQELAPNSQIFRELEVTLNNPDPLLRIKKMAAIAHPNDEAGQALEILFTLRSLAIQEETRAGQLEEQGEADEAAAARALAERARAEEQVNRAKIEQLAPHHRRFFEYQFTGAVLSEDWERAEQLVADVSDPRSPVYGIDQADGALFQGRLLMARGQYEHAARLLRQAAEQIPYDAETWRLLAIAYQQVGNMPEAVNAYDRAYANNPNDIRTVGLYADALNRSGDQMKALQVVRKGRQLAPDNEQMWHQWMLLEAEVGDRALVLRKRREQFEAKPQDATNAITLASFLVRTEPSYDVLLDENGEAQYSSDRWFRMSNVQRQAILQDARRQWYDEADQIVERLGAEGQRDQRWHLLKADLLRARGEIDAGDEVLRSFAETQTEREPRLRALLALGQYQAQVNRVAEALETFDRARQDQGEYREADYLMGQFLFGRNRFEEAIEHFESVLEAHENRRLEIQLVQCFVSLRRFDEARRRFEALMEESDADLFSTLLEATIVSGEAGELWLAGRKDEAQRKYAENAEILERAVQLSPMSPSPFVERARSLYSQAQRTGDLVLLDDALRSLARADEVQVDHPDTSKVRVAILLAKNNRIGAINELKRIVERNPLDIDDRVRLVALLVDENRVGEAVQLLAEAVRLNPTSVARREMLGDLYKLSAGDPGAAAEQYAAALELTPSSRLVRKLAESLMAKQPPDRRAALELINRYPSELEADPVLRSVHALVLVAVGRRDEGLEQMRSAYRQHRQYIEAGRESPGAIGDWFVRLSGLFPPRQPADVEAFVMDLTGGELGPRESHALALYWRSVGTAGMRRAIELLRQAVEICPPEDEPLLAGLYTELGLTLLMAEEIEAAVEAYERVVQVQPDNANVLNNLAYALSEKMNQPERALPYAQRAADLESNNGSILDTLGWVRYQLGVYDEAETVLRRSVQLEPTATSHYHLACVFHKKGDRRAAERQLQRAVELKPDPETQAKINRLANDIRTRGTDGE